MKAFRVSGTFKMGREMTRFTMETADESEDGARERVVSTIGSRHRVRRNRVNIDSIEEVPAEDLEDEAVRKRVEEA